jgi:CRP-like cAMP-binding protein/Ca2+-binding EF-hand superfamily protein
MHGGTFSRGGLAGPPASAAEDGHGVSASWPGRAVANGSVAVTWAEPSPSGITAPPVSPPPTPPKAAMRGRRQSVSAEAFAAGAAAAAGGGAGSGVEGGSPPVRQRTREMTPSMRSRVLEAMRGNLLFTSMGEHEKRHIVDKMFDVEKAAGDTIMAQGEEGDNLYVIDYGRCEVHIEGKGLVHVYDNEGIFGELALMYNSPRAATVRAATGTLLWAMDRQMYQAVRRESQQAQRDELRRFFDGVELFRGLTGEQQAQLVDLCLREEEEDGVSTFRAGQAIMRQGEEGHEFYVLRSGSAEAAVEGYGVVKQYTAGGFFGELALMAGGGTRNATITATSDSTCLVVPRRDFIRLLGPLDDLLQQEQQEYSRALVRAKRAGSDDGREQPPQPPQQPPQQDTVTAAAPEPVPVSPPPTPPTPPKAAMPVQATKRQNAQPTSQDRLPMHAQPNEPSSDVLPGTLASMTTIGAVLKMVEAIHPETLHTGAAYRFQLAQHDGLCALVLRWTDTKTREPVGFIDLADVSKQTFDAGQMLIQLWPYHDDLPPLHLVASCEEDYELFKTGLSFIHQEHQRYRVVPLASFPASHHVGERQQEEPDQPVQTQSQLQPQTKVQQSNAGGDEQQQRQTSQQEAGVLLGDFSDEDSPPPSDCALAGAGGDAVVEGSVNPKQSQQLRATSLEAESRVAMLEAELRRLRQSITEESALRQAKEETAALKAATDVTTPQHTEAWVTDVSQGQTESRYYSGSSEVRTRRSRRQSSSSADHRGEVIVSLPQSRGAVTVTVQPETAGGGATPPQPQPQPWSHAERSEPRLHTAVVSHRPVALALEQSEQLDTLAQRLKSFSYGSTGQDPVKLLRHFDKNRSGELDLTEFTAAVRKGGRMTRAMMPDADIQSLFTLMDKDQSGTVGIDELKHFVWGRNRQQIRRGKQGSATASATAAEMAALGRPPLSAPLSPSSAGRRAADRRRNAMARRSRARPSATAGEEVEDEMILALPKREVQILQLLGQRLKSLSYGSNGQDKSKILRHFDRDNTGELDFGQFVAAVRKGGKMTRAIISDAEVRNLFVELDVDSSGTISIDELAAFIWGTDGHSMYAGVCRRRPDGSSHDASTPRFVSARAQHRRRLNLKHGATVELEPNSSDEDFDATCSNECQWYSALSALFTALAVQLCHQCSVCVHPLRPRRLLMS